MPISSKERKFHSSPAEDSRDSSLIPSYWSISINLNLRTMTETSTLEALVPSSTFSSSRPWQKKIVRKYWRTEKSLFRRIPIPNCCLQNRCTQKFEIGRSQRKSNWQNRCVRMPWIEHNRILSWHRKKFDEIFVFSYCIRILFRYHACRNEDGSDWWNAINWQVSKQGLPWPSASVRGSSAKANVCYWLAFFFVPWAG